MSDDFIPLNQSTPVHNQKRDSGRFQQSRQQANWQNKRGGNRWGHNNSQRNSSYGSGSNSSYGHDTSSIDAYLHPSMLQDPWAYLRRRNAESQSS